MVTDRVWAIRGVSDRTRDVVLETAHDAGLTIGEWLDQVLARAVEEARHPRPPAATREEVAELLDARLKPIEAALGRLAEQQSASPEGRASSRGVEPGSVGEMAAVVPSPVGAEQIRERPEAGRAEVRARGRQRRQLPEDVRTRIDELHQAGRSMYAISKELDVPYSTVYAYVKSRGGRA